MFSHFSGAMHKHHNCTKKSFVYGPKQSHEPYSTQNTYKTKLTRLAPAECVEYFTHIYVGIIAAVLWSVCMSNRLAYVRRFSY